MVEGGTERDAAEARAAKRLRPRSGPVLVLGRAGMDLYADPPGTRIEGAGRFVAALGGSAGNIAAGLARQGVAAGLVAAVSDDAVGRFVAAELARYGVDATHLHRVGGEARTSLAVCETALDPSVTIYRNGAADLGLTEAMTAEVDPRRAGALVVAGTALASAPSRGATLALMARMRDADRPVILDIDHRPYSWLSPAAAAAAYAEAAALAHGLVGNEEEFTVLALGGDGAAEAERLAGAGACVVYKRGAAGSRTLAPGVRFDAGIFPVAALKPMGSGDAFLAGFVAALARGAPLREAVRRGSAAAAMVVSAVGCAPAMPTTEALDAFVAARAGEGETA